MSIVNELSKNFRIDASCNASEEHEIKQLIKFAKIKIPDEYLELIREGTEMEINIHDVMYLRIWGASSCIELNEAYYIQKYMPHSLAIGDDEGEYVLLYANGQYGFGVYAVAFDDLDEEEMIFIAKSLRELLVYEKGIEILKAL